MGIRAGITRKELCRFDTTVILPVIFICNVWNQAIFMFTIVGEAVASWLEHWTPYQAVQVQVLAGDIV